MIYVATSGAPERDVAALRGPAALYNHDGLVAVVLVKQARHVVFLHEGTGGR